MLPRLNYVNSIIACEPGQGGCKKESINQSKMQNSNVSEALVGGGEGEEKGAPSPSSPSFPSTRPGPGFLAKTRGRKHHCPSIIREKPGIEPRVNR